MKVLLFRVQHDEQATRGEFMLDGRFQCLSLEDAPHEVKIPGKTRIPAGSYALELKPIGTSKFDATAQEILGEGYLGMIRLVGVPDFSEILIHWGNDNEDTDGCLLTGTVKAKDPNGFLAVGESRAAWKVMYPKIAQAISSGEGADIKVYGDE